MHFDASCMDHASPGVRQKALSYIAFSTCAVYARVAIFTTRDAFWRDENLLILQAFS